MPRSSGGVCTPPPGTDAVTGQIIASDPYNNRGSDLYSLLTDSLSRSGKGGMQANLAMGSFKVTGLGTPTNPQDAVTLSYVSSLNATIQNQLDVLIPIGIILDYAGVSGLPGASTWALCYGQAISRTTYATLFARLGTTFGAGNGTTTFNLPDLRGRLVAGQDNMGGVAANRLTAAGSGVNGALIGATGGLQNVQLAIANLPAHNHGGTTGGVGDHTHSYTTPSAIATTLQIGAGLNAIIGAGANTGAAGAHSHSISSQGSDTPHINVQPTMVLSKIIRIL